MKNNKSTNKNKNHTSKTTYAQQLVVEQPHIEVEHNTPVPRTLTEVSKNSNKKENGIKNFHAILPCEETENPVATESGNGFI